MRGECGCEGHRSPFCRYWMSYKPRNPLAINNFLGIIFVRFKCLGIFEPILIISFRDFTGQQIERHLPNRLTMPTFDRVSKVAVKMTLCSAVAPKIHANVCAFPLDVSMWFINLS